MRKTNRFTPLWLAGVVGLAGCSDNTPTTPLPGSPSLSTSSGAETGYVILGSGNRLPRNLSAAVTAAGGSLTAALGQIGVAFATSSDAAFASSASAIGGVQAVVPDLVVQWVEPVTGESIELGEEGVEPQVHEVGGHESFRLAQWAPDAVNAPAAWATGQRGAGARVAIVDGGIASNHLDIAPNLDAARSVSFVPFQPYNFDTGTFWHGTHVAGIVAAPINNLGTVGIAPEATLIGVKVLHGGSGAFSWVINGIIYAATPISQGGAGAHIINMSLGAYLPKTGQFGPSLPHLFNAVSRATNYAYQQGVTVIAAAGNSAVDMDHDANFFFIPAQSTSVNAVAATGPTGFGFTPPMTNFDRPASYTNFGQSAIDFAGGGGDGSLAGTPAGDALCTKPRLPVGTITVPCWVFDMVMSPTVVIGTSHFYTWAAGTSMASPVVAGVAALIVGKHGPMHPAQVQARLRQSADDLGKRGNDDFYGAGRVNALRAVQ